MPDAQGQKFHYLDHDTAQLDITPPVLNQWYTVLDAYDVRLIWNLVYQANGEVAAKNVEIRWTIDGTVYFTTFALPNGTDYWIARWAMPSAGGTAGLYPSVNPCNGAFYVDKRGQRFKIEVRITSALGTNQRLIMDCVYETLELT